MPALHLYRLLFLFYLSRAARSGLLRRGQAMCNPGFTARKVCGRWTLAELSSEEDQRGTYISDSLNRAVSS